MDPVTSIQREMSGRVSSPSPGTKPRPRRIEKPAPRSGFLPQRKKQPLASERSSMLGQKWYDLGVEQGFDFPYDANYFALALQNKVEGDNEIRKILALGPERVDQVERWVAKMIEIWWNPVDKEGNGGYLSGEVTARNAKEYFLNHDWDDLREFARSSLRATYLMKHGERVPAPIYPGQKEYQERLRDLRERQQVESYLRTHPEQGERPEVDETRRERLRSFVTKRRKK